VFSGILEHMEASASVIDERLCYSIEALVRVTDISRSTIRRAIASGDLRATRVNRRVLILRDDALAWLGGARETS
jgi:excisionase family DNA binding protein